MKYVGYDSPPGKTNTDQGTDVLRSVTKITTLTTMHVRFGYFRVKYGTHNMGGRMLCTKRGKISAKRGVHGLIIIIIIIYVMGVCYVFYGSASKILFSWRALVIRNR